MLRRSVLSGLAAACLAAGVALGQSQPAMTALEIPPPILTIDGERLFTDTAFGKRLAGDLEEAGRALAAENRDLEAQLSEEERKLTEQRPTLPTGEFRILADAFDTRVQAIRAEQDQKERDLLRLRDRSRAEFLNQIAPVLSEIVRERRALVILDRRDVFLSADSIDITSEAIRRIDEALGEGNGANGTTTSDK